MRVLLVFVDGIGFGRSGPQNPFFETPLDVLAPLGGGDLFPGASFARVDRQRRSLVAIDASLGHPGLPQSATGQATIFTGTDAIALAGGHASGYPSRKLRELITREGFLGKARVRGRSAKFLNAYDERRARHVENVLAGKEVANRRFPPSASSVCGLAEGNTLSTWGDLKRGRAATFDLTGDLLRAAGLDAPRISIDQAARNVAAGAAESDVTLFEMFLTDAAGHSQDTEWARDEAVRTDRFLRVLFEAIDPSEQLVVVTSDHGNLEDLSVRTHTRAPVPLLAYGARAADFTAGAKTLLDVAPRLLAFTDQ